MLDARDIAVELLKQFANELGSMRQDDFENLMRGRSRVVFEVKRAPAKKPQDDAESNAGYYAPELVEQLKSLKSRDEALNCLQSSGLTKRSLIQMCKAIGVQASREDTVQRLYAKIVEATVGFRLRSRAIQGEAALRLEAD